VLRAIKDSLFGAPTDFCRQIRIDSCPERPALLEDETRIEGAWYALRREKPMKIAFEIESSQYFH